MQTMIRASHALQQALAAAAVTKWPRIAAHTCHQQANYPRALLVKTCENKVAMITIGRQL